MLWSMPSSCFLSETQSLYSRRFQALPIPPQAYFEMSPMSTETKRKELLATLLDMGIFGVLYLCIVNVVKKANLKPGFRISLFKDMLSKDGKALEEREIRK